MNNYLVVFDTGALVQSAISPSGAAARCFTYFEQGKISIAVSRATLKEVKDVLSRPEIRQRFPHLTDEEVFWGWWIFCLMKGFTYARFRGISPIRAIPKTNPS